MSLFFKRKKRNHKKNVEQTIIPVFDISPFGYDTVFCDDMVMSMNCRETHELPRLNSVVSDKLFRRGNSSLDLIWNHGIS